MSVSIVSVSRRTKSFPAATSGFDVVVETEADRLHVSRMDGEDRWIVDGQVRRRNGFPVFMNGFGARFCALVPASAEVVAAIEAEVASVA